MSRPAALTGLRQPTSVRIAGRTYEVPVVPISLWLASLDEAPGLFALLPLLEAKTINARLYDPDDPLLDDPEALDRAWREALAAQSGLPWYVALRLLLAMQSQWHDIAGHVLPLDLFDAPLDLALSAALHVGRSSRQSEKELREFDQRLWALPPEVDVDDAEPPPGFSDADEAAAWTAAAAATTGRARPQAGAGARLR